MTNKKLNIMKQLILTTAKSLGFLKNNFSIFKVNGSWCLSSNLNCTVTGDKQCKEVMSKLNFSFEVIQVSTIFEGVTTPVFKLN